MTTRELILSWQSEVLNATKLDPNRAADLLAKSAALMGNVTDEILARQIAYNEKLAELITENPATKAKIIADVTPEYKSMQEAKNAETSLTELIRALKYYLKAQEREYEASYRQ